MITESASERPEIRSNRVEEIESAYKFPISARINKLMERGKASCFYVLILTNSYCLGPAYMCLLLG